MKKILFLAILFGALLLGGVASAFDEGKCYCDTILNDGSVKEFQALYPVQNLKDCTDGENKQVFQFDDVVIMQNCNWVPATPKSKTGGPPSGGPSSGAGTGGISAAPVKPTIVELENPMGKGRTDISKILGDIIKYAMGILCSLTLLVFVYGGFLWLISAGSDERVKKGSQTMLWAVIGIFIIFASYGILTLVFKAIGAN